MLSGFVETPEELSTGFPFKFFFFFLISVVPQVLRVFIYSALQNFTESGSIQKETVFCLSSWIQLGNFDCCLQYIP